MKDFQNKRVWLGGGLGAALLILAVAWFMFIGPEFSSADSVNAQAAATLQENQVLQAQVKSLQIKSAEISKYTSALKTALASLPFDSGLPAFTRQLSAQARANSVVVNSVLVGGVSSVATTTVAPVAPIDGTTTTAAAPASDSTATPAPVVPTTSTAAGGLFAVQITITSSGTLAHQLAFLSAVRTAGPRRALVTSAQITPGTGAKEASIDGIATFTTQLTVFSAPQTPAQVTQLTALLSGKIGN